jgi:hypothetical protein
VIKTYKSLSQLPVKLVRVPLSLSHNFQKHQLCSLYIFHLLGDNRKVITFRKLRVGGGKEAVKYFAQLKFPRNVT